MGGEDLGLPRKIPGTTLSIACLSGLEAVHHAVALIEHGEIAATDESISISIKS